MNCAALILLTLLFGLAHAQDYNQTFEAGLKAVREGRFPEAIAAFETCLKISPENPDCAYDLACTYALLEDREQALKWLEQAIQWGDRNVGHMRRDTDLKSLREDPQFLNLVERVRSLRTRERDKRAAELFHQAGHRWHAIWNGVAVYSFSPPK
jgi:tetratricopeptide (TPR) repeat protein